MNLYLRLLWLFLTARFKSRIDPLEPLETRHHVLLNDIDLLGHMNNGRYFTITDLARMELLIRAGIWRIMRTRGIYPVSAGQTMQFRKPLMPLQRYSIVTRTAGWDRHFIYVEHIFRHRETIHALMLMKVRIVGHGNHRVTPKELFDMVDDRELEEIRMDSVIEQWNDSSHRHWLDQSHDT